ncbi:uncharacterized protein ASPGLDRAFT_168449 [Aspergillus glaucus CBS 516.65]|uniref:Major facilitator superfamily (MFS) profile domain-containing protein n=1 Tax=Aspergillus glaucus CBS 516.65 TaxID=1160497 RepID=A0A1L9VN75_ASPGL|nr:hypothetical protein ASPGLDRAFT_168449 [Aspergillus glaucus CBS 516.65]OJJ85377.1 hypothetical protein ASPGLDRAFT_168449 [Aspergillus glaucus CBS 516.65]
MDTFDDTRPDTRPGQHAGFSETSPLIEHGLDSNKHHDQYYEPESNTNLPGTSAPGATRIESFSSRISAVEQGYILTGILIIGWSYGLDGLLRSTYQSYAASSFGVHTLLSTINVLRSVIAAAVYPPAAKLADVFGRFELIAVSVAFYIVGTVIESTASSIQAFIAGAILYQTGYTCIILLVEVIIADITSMRSRVFFSYVPAIPFLFNTWLSGSLASAALKVTDWRWGIGMWAPIYAVSATPLLVGLYRTSLYGKNSGDSHESHRTTLRAKAVEIYHQLDIIGISLMMAVLILILTPLTLAEGQLSQWRSPSIITPLILGCLCIPVFIYWETHGARHPFIPGYLLKDRGVGTALAVRCLLNIAWAVQGNYLYTVLIVAFNFSVSTSTQVSSFFTFFGVISGLIIGVVIFRVRRLKYFIVTGTILFLISFVLLIRFNSGTSHSAATGMLSAQVLLGLAAGFCAYPTQASIQATTSHKHVSALTGLYLASFNIGNALGTCLSGVIWSENLLRTLESNLSFQSNETLAHEIYKSPFEVVPDYPVGTEIRSAIIDSYGHVERMLCIAGVCLCVPMIGFACAMMDPRLSSGQSQPEAEREE